MLKKTTDLCDLNLTSDERCDLVRQVICHVRPGVLTLELVAWRLFPKESAQQIGELGHASVHRRRDGVEPVDTGDVILKLARWGHVFDANRNDYLLGVGRDLEFSRNVFGSIRVIGKYERDDAGSIYRFGDLPCIGNARDRISWRNPAIDAAAFERCANGIGDGLILR